jgi:hypothetical protein
MDGSNVTSGPDGGAEIVPETSVFFNKLIRLIAPEDLTDRCCRTSSREGRDGKKHKRKNERR